MPLGSGAAYGGSVGITWGQYINYDSYSMPIYRASASDPPRTITATGGTFPGPYTVAHWPAAAAAAAGTDQDVIVIDPTGRFSDEFWCFGCSGAGMAGTHIHYDLQGSAWLGWMRGAGTSFLGGLIRPTEVAAGSIPHVLAIATSGVTQPPGGPCPIPPAVGCDGSQEAGLMAIPPGTPMPAQITDPLGRAIWNTLEHYGAYAVDNAGGNTLSAEAPDSDPASTSSAYTNAIGAALADMPIIMGYLQWVTNNSPAQWGGPGARLAPTAPGF